MLLIVLGTGCSRDVDIAPPRPGTDSPGNREGSAQALVGRLDGWLSGRSNAQVAELAAPGTLDLLTAVRDNVRRLRVVDLSLRYVEEGAVPDDREAATFGDDAWSATVDLGYRLAGIDRAQVHMETELLLVPGGDGALVAGIGGADVRTPLWLQDRLTVVRTADSLLAVAGDRTGRYPTLVRRAVGQVGEVLGRSRGSLVVEVPRNGEQLDQALLASAGQYDNIAAVTTTADGSLAPGAPVRVFVNPGVFDRLKARGAQVVMTHEASHAATQAPFATMPTWLLEGFADYVALARADIPVSVAAGQVLDRIENKGLPRRLPSSADLDPSASGLGATYEEAWLACRFLALEYGEQALLRFYRTVDRGSSTREAFRSVLNTTEARFVAEWRQDLDRLVRVAG